MKTEIGLAQSAIISLSNVMPQQFPRIPNAGTLYALLEGMRGQNAENVGDAMGTGLNAGFVSKDATGKPVVKIRHYQPSTAATSTTENCDAAKNDYTETTQTIGMYRQVGLLVDWAYLSGLGKEAAKIYNGGLLPDGSRYSLANTAIMEDVRLKIMSLIYKLVKDINSDLITKLGTRFGVNARTGLATTKSVDLFDATGNKLEMGYNEILTDYQYSELSGTPIVIGGVKMQQYVNSMKWGCCSNAGTDFSKIMAENPFGFYFDKKADTVFGANQIAVVAPEAAQLATYNRYTGPFAGEFGNGDFGSFSLPEFPGLKFDLQVEKISCPTPQLKIIVGLWFDVITAQDIYAAGDELEDVNGILRFTAATRV